MPIATAMRFLRTPPNSVPMTSVLTNVRKYWLRARRATASAVSWLIEAITAAVGCSRAISSARFGPDATAMRIGSQDSSCSITWLIRRPVRRSTPFMSETIGTPVPETSGRTAFRFSRTAWLGIERYTWVAPSSASERWWVADISRGRLMPGRYWLLRLASLISCASSGRRAHIVTWAPPSARTLPNVVPQLPAPITTTRGSPASDLRLKATRLSLPVLGRIPALRGRRLTAQLRQELGDGTHETVGGGDERRGLRPSVGELGEVDGIADDHPHAAPQRPEAELAVAGQDGLRTPVRHRDERDV